MTTLTDRALLWTYRRLSAGWLTWALGLSLLAVVSWSIDLAAWVPDASPVTFNLFAGALFGACLAISRWRGRWAAAYLLITGAAFTLQAVGKVVPPLVVLSGMPVLDQINLMNVRLFALFDRMAGWAALYQGGESIKDTGLFLVIFGLLAWASGAWLSWCLRRTRLALSGLLPCGLLLALNVHFGGQDAWIISIFLGLGLALIARTSFTGAIAGWERRAVDYPDDLGLSWAGWAALVVVMLFSLGRAAPLLGTPEGWKTLSDLFKPAQQQVEDAASRMFADVRPPRITPETPVRADTPRLDAVGLAPVQGDGVVFWVTTDDPPMPPQAIGIPEEARQLAPRHYWRSGIFATYNGLGWEPAPLDSAPFESPPGDPPIGRAALVQSFDIPAQHGSDLFAANQPVAAEKAQENGLALVQGANDPYSSLLRTAPRPGLVVNQYTVTSWISKPTSNQLNAANQQIPPEIAGPYLQLPANLPQRVRNLATRLAAGATTRYQIALRIQDYLRLTYSYSLTVPPPPPGRDVVDYFLFEAPGGFCTYYASAMAVMLRVNGVPARLATGFAPGVYDDKRSAYRVQVSDAHAWVEVYFPGLGWVEFEPTISQNAIVYPTVDVGAGTGPTPTPAPGGLRLSPALTAALLALVLLAGGGLLFLLFRLAGRTRGGRLPDQALQAQALYRSMRRWLRRAGLAAQPSQTPAEYLDASRAALAQRPALTRALEQATSLYEQATYAPRTHPPSRQQVEEARRAWGRALRDWVALLLKKK